MALGTARGATPSSGAITTLTPTQTYSSGPFLQPNPTPTPIVDSEPTCDAAHPCDLYTLTVTLPASYASTHPNDVIQITSSWPPLGGGVQSDYDVWVYDSTGHVVPTHSATSNDPEVAMLPAVSATYTVKIIPFHPAGETVTTTIVLGPAPPSPFRSGTYETGTDVWSKNVHLKGTGLTFSHNHDAEPAVRFDPNGTAFVVSNGGSLTGGSGLGMWKISEACGQQYSFLEPEFPFYNGGGDCDVEAASQKNVNGFYNIYTSSLHATDALVNINTSVSLDGGNTFVTGVISDQVPVNDRQWTAAYGASTVWLSFRSLATGNNLFVYRSIANGLPGTFQGPFPVYADVVTSAAVNTQLGNMVADQRPVPGSTLPLMAGPDGEGTLYHGFVLGQNQIYVGVSTDMGTTWHSQLVFSGPQGADYGQNFSWVSVDRAGNVYTCFCDQSFIYYCASIDHGVHWTRPMRVNDGPFAKSCTMPAMAAGSAGRLVFSWYSTSSADGIDNSDSKWTVMSSRTEAALDSVPAFEQVLVSDHYIHSGMVCLGGTSCTANRELLDLFEMDVDPTDGSSFITYTDDGAEGGTYISKQLAGISAIAGKTIVDKSQTCPTNLPCVTCPPPPPPDPCQLPGVTVVRDPSGDQNGAPANSEADIDSVMIAEPFFADGSRKLVATLKVDNLTPQNLPPNNGWEVLFTSPNGTEYFLEMDTFDPTTGVQFHYGHVDPTLGESTDGAIEGHVNALGFITMFVDDALVGNPSRGQTLTAVHGQTEVLVGAQPGGTGGGELVFLDTTPNGTYTLFGNASCGLFGLISPPDQTVAAADLKTLFFQISNSSGAAAQYQYGLNDSQGWTTGHSAPLTGTTPSIPAGQLFTLQVDATVPIDCTKGRDTYRWSAYPVGNAAAAETSFTHLSCGVPETACRLPGITVVTDATGDQAGSPALTQLDVQHAWMAEPYTGDGSQKLIVTMKVADLTPPLTPNGVWRTFWTMPHAGGSANDSTYYVAMSTDQTGTPSYAFGVFITNATTGTITQTQKGAAVGSESPDGTIQIASPLVYAGSPAAGTTLGKITTESRVLVGTSVTGGLIEQMDIGGGTGQYTLVGNDGCALALVGPAGRAVDCGSLPLDFYLMNTGPGAANFEYHLADSLHWTASASAPLSGETGSLAPGATFTLAVGAFVPSGLGMQNVYRWTGAISGQPSTLHLLQTTFADTCNATTGVDGSGNRPNVLALARAVPNPFTRATRIDYEIPTRGLVKLSVYSVTGERIQTLVDGMGEPGRGSATFDGRRFPPGLYYVRLEAAGRKLVRSMILLR
jgi:hypothetical protein